MPLYDAVRDLEASRVERVRARAARASAEDFTRRTTVVHLHGGGEEGVGEDVSYDGRPAARVQPAPRCPTDRRAHARLVLGARRRPAGLPALGARARGARPRAAPGRTLARRGARREPRPVTFVVSAERDPELLDLYPDTPLQARRERLWTDEIVAELAATGAVDVVDLKGLYEGDWLDATPIRGALPPRRRGLPARLARGRPAERRDARPCSSRTATGSPGTSRSTRVADVEALPFAAATA